MTASQIAIANFERDGLLSGGRKEKIHYEGAQQVAEDDSDDDSVSETDARELALVPAEYTDVTMPMYICWAIGMGLEVGLLIMGFLLFSARRDPVTHLLSPGGDLEIPVTMMWMLGVFVVFWLFRICTALPTTMHGGKLEARDYVLLRIRMYCFLVPFAIYMPLIVSCFVNVCSYELKSKHFKTWSGEGETYMDMYVIQCPVQAGGHDLTALVMLVKIIGQIGIPTLFAFLFVKLGEEVWKIDFMDDSTRHHLLMSTVDFLDCSTFICLPWYPSEFEYLKLNPDWMALIIVLFVIAYVAVLLRIIVVANLPKRHKRGGCWERINATVSVLFIELPFLVCRLYLNVAVGLTINPLLLVKNLACLIHGLAIIICGPNNYISQQLIMVIMLVPGSEKIQMRASQEIYQRLEEKLHRARAQRAAAQILKDVMSLGHFNGLPMEGRDIYTVTVESLYMFDLKDSKQRTGRLDWFELNFMFKLIHRGEGSKHEIMEIMADELKELEAHKEGREVLDITVEDFAVKFLDKFWVGPWKGAEEREAIAADFEDSDE